MYLGDFTTGGTIRGYFNTRTAAGTPITIGGSAALAVYKDGSVAQSVDGVAAISVDFDGLTGLHLFSVDTSSNGTFYSAGSDFRVVLTAGTVDGVSVVGVKVAEFSLLNRSALRPTVAGRTLDVSAGGEAGIDLANVGSPTTTLNLSGTTVKAVTDAVALPSSASINITGNITGNLSGSVGSVTGAVGSISGVTFPANFASTSIDVSGRVLLQPTQTGVTIPTVTTLTNLPSIPANWLTAAGIANGAFTNAKFATGAIRVAGDEFGNTLVLTNLATASQIPAEFTSATFASAGVFATSALVNAPSGSGPTASAIADAVWDEVLSGHLTAGSTGNALNAAGSAGDPWSTVLPGAYTGDQAGSILDAIRDKTGLITADTVNYTQPVGPNGQISRPIFIGDDYLAANGRAFTWDITARTGFSAATASCTFGIWNDSLSLGFDVPGTVTDNGDGTWELSFDVTKTETASLSEGNYRWTVELSNPSTNEVTEVYSTRTVEVREKHT